MRNDHSHINVCLFVCWKEKPHTTTKCIMWKHWNILQTISIEDNRENVNLLLTEININILLLSVSDVIMSLHSPLFNYIFVCDYYSDCLSQYLNKKKRLLRIVTRNRLSFHLALYILEESIRFQKEKHHFSIKTFFVAMFLFLILIVNRNIMLTQYWHTTSTHLSVTFLQFSDFYSTTSLAEYKIYFRF